MKTKNKYVWYCYDVPVGQEVVSGTGGFLTPPSTRIVYGTQREKTLRSKAEKAVSLNHAGSMYRNFRIEEL